MKRLILELPDNVYEILEQLREELQATSVEELAANLLARAAEQELRRVRAAKLIPEEEPYDVEKFIKDVRAAREK